MAKQGEETSGSTGLARLARGLSLADKCALLFGAAIVLILAVALLVPWARLGAVIDESQVYTSRQLVQVWEAERAARAREGGDTPPPTTGQTEARIEYISAADLPARAKDSEFLAAAVRRFGRDERRPEPEHSEAIWDGRDRVYRYARAERDQAGALLGVTFVERRSSQASGLLLVNRIFVVCAGLVAVALATVVFYQITTRIILSPVRKLRRTAEAVRAGDMSIRSEIATGDEFEELADAFNSMLAGINSSQEQLRSANLSMDLRISQLAESNTALEEANRLKSEFLANVSHELRTPLGSIIGFAELLQAQTDADAATPEERQALQKRRRYLDNIVSAGRSLLEMIEELLQMARIEAGRIDLRVEPMNVAETCDGLLALIRPLAEKKGQTLTLELPTPPPLTQWTDTGAEPTSDAGGLPVIRTDHRKLQQIIFNFLSNAVKFTPEGGRVTLRAERLPAADGAHDERVRISVLDTGPGIREQDHAVIFEKFRQLGEAHTRETGGTGLGLAIARDFAGVIQGEIQLVSAPGSGSMFSLIVPVRLDEEKARVSASRLAGRAASSMLRPSSPAPAVSP